MQNEALGLDFLRFQGLIQRLDGELAGNPFPVFNCDDATVIKVNNSAVISQGTVCKEQICKIRTQDLVFLGNLKMLIQEVRENLVSLSFLVTGTFRPTVQNA